MPKIVVKVFRKEVMPVYFEVMKKDHVELAWSFSVNSCSCDKPEVFEEHLKFSAISDNLCGENTTHILIDEDDKTKEKHIIGFISLRASAYIQQFDGYDKATGYPALEIQYLAVDKKYEHKGYGKLLVYKAIDIAATLCEEHLGIKYIVLRSDKKAVSFYTKKTFGFKPLDRIGKIPSNSWNENCIPLISRFDPNHI